MKRFLWTFLFIAVMGAVASARIGETLEECDQRYGTRTKAELNEEGNGTVYYKKNELSIIVHIYAGYCDLIRYQPGGPLVRIDLEVAEYLRNINGRSKQWIATRPGVMPSQMSGGDKGDDRKNSSSSSKKSNKSYKPARKAPIEPKAARQYYWVTSDEKIEATFTVSSGMLEVKSIRGTIVMKNMIVEGL
ncbi:MAG: hypothetical protein K9M45_00280 [Kiritimatiellales bacterium]|nr:hypothetical protein [Kiritimatiellales bacterium]